MNGSIGIYFTCSGCHYKGDANWSQMNSAFASAGLQTPPEITNGTGWNGINQNYYNHSLDTYDDLKCKSCHGQLLSENASMVEFIHKVAEGAGGEECLACHMSRQGIYPAIDNASFAKHRNVNTTDGVDNLTNGDCLVCHNNFNYTEMMQSGFTTPTMKCTECHIDGNFSAPVIAAHRPPSLPVTQGGIITTQAYCATCHNNSINRYAYSINASVGHYGTNASLIRPTVNQTSTPRFGFMNQADASAYNRACNNCHNPSNESYGNATLIQYGHNFRGTCNQCHVNGNADNLHNASLSMPVTFSCKQCHTAYADQYKAPNLTGTYHGLNYDCSFNCHITDGGVAGQLDILADHNLNFSYAPINLPSGDTVYLNGQTALNVSRGTIVTITSRVKDSTGLASRAGGAEYYIGIDPGTGKGIPMDASDGRYDAVEGAWEDVTAQIDTSGLSDGTYAIYVRGMDIGKQWSSPLSATLTIQSLGYINGTVRNSIDWPIKGAIVIGGGRSTTTADDGNYSLSLEAGTYNVTASKQPEYYDTMIPNVNVTTSNTTMVYIVVTGKPTGTLSGVVRTA